MYTVLIFDNRTAESFKSFRPLFADVIRNGELGICVWSKELSNTKVETALPKIYEMVGDKKEWRAIIIQSELGDETGEYRVDSKNPFDYMINREAYLSEIERSRKAQNDFESIVKELDPNDPEFLQKKRQARLDTEPNFNMHEESRIPLVSLTHMLGGVPKQTPLFIEGEPVVDDDTQKYVRNVITVPDREAEELYRTLERKYRFQANRPKELILIAARPQQEENLDDIKSSWKNYDDLESSQFWSYNHYAACCRFLTYEVEKKGSVQAEGDLFKLWLTVGLLAANPMDPSTFQAYHLYSVRLHLDSVKLETAFNHVASALLSAKKYLNHSIDQDHKRLLNEKIDPPEYKLSISVSSENNDVGRILVDEDCYKLAARDFEGDVDTFVRDREETDRNLTKLRRLISRSVEGAAEKMRGNCSYDPEQVEALSNYQTKEFNEQLKDTYQEILDDQVLLPFDEISALRREKCRKQNSMLEVLKSRMDAQKLVTGYVVTALSVLLALLPSFIHSRNTQTSVLIPVLACLTISAFIYLVLLIVIAVVQKKELLEELSKYNGILARIKGKIDSNANAYSGFLSGVGSHMHGSSYLNILRHKVFRREDITQQKRHHLEEINKFRLVMEDWARALYVDCDFDLLDQNDSLQFDEYDMPDFGSLYMLEYGKKYKIPINKSGELTSSYSFITGLDVVREEIYDDVIFSRDLDSRDTE